MGFISKFAWLALPALFGCGVLAQVASQGTGSHPVGKARVNGLVAANALNDEAESIFNRFNVEPFFIVKRAFPDWKPYSDEYRTKHLTKNGQPLTWDEVESLKQSATLMAYNNSAVSLQSAKNILNSEVSVGKPARKITDIVGELLHKELDNLLRDSGYSNISKDMRGIMELRAASGWTRRYTSYQMRNLGNGGTPVNTQKILSQDSPNVICTDATVIARDIARKIASESKSGLKAYFVEGSLLFPGQRWDGRKNISHAWLGGVLASRMKMPSDPTPNALEDQKRANWNIAVSSFRDCPTDPVSAELFMASYCDKNSSFTDFEKRLANGEKLQSAFGITDRQGDRQIYVNLGNNPGLNPTGKWWETWLEQDQPYRDKLAPLHNWYTTR